MNQTTPPTSAPAILPLEGKITAAQVEAACPGPRTIFACDFYIEGAEAGTDDAGSLKLGRTRSSSCSRSPTGTIPRSGR